ncbi:uncharacterized protein LOC115634570 [Scaptodrosophila lebanonensis]|uniref:Uncharacterized protein LOC115634570 n=1 Tax=Drosophila lebanonensis TaxID=7225 RepID=A0A6J2UJ43_DROLE|nr:uncharacterized protein LOC115634570 [Scaptodrosophila lebanonensis]
MDLPENLQVIKLETPTTPEKAANIKERLNLHVKRRLQQDVPEPPVGDLSLTSSEISKRSKVREMSVATKARKPYQKRVEKIKTDANRLKKAQIASPAAELETSLHDDGQEIDAAPEMLESKASGRERYKNADILSIVLSAKKRALLQHPEVQDFWSKIMAAIKS